MTHRQRILADRTLAAPAAFCFNILARTLGTILRRNHAVNPGQVREIIVAKLVGMGSAVQATPLLKALKQRCPNAKITFLTLRSNRTLVERLPAVDEVLCLDDRSTPRLGFSIVRIVATLIRRRADLYFDLEVYSAFASLLALWAVTRNRIGFYRHSSRFKKGIYTHLIYFNTRMSIRKLYLQLGRVVGVDPNADLATGPLRIDEADRQGMRTALQGAPGWQADQPYVIINANASDLLLERRWPTPYVVHVAEKLTAAGHTVVLVGSAPERAYVRDIFDRLSPGARERTVDTAGRLTLPQFLALLDGAACVLTNDTGPMHIAVALNRPTVCLFGPGDPGHYGHEHCQVATFYAPVFCSPCIYEIDKPPCNGNNICMQRIDPEPVVQVILNFLRGDAEALPAQGRMIRLPLMTDDGDGKPLGLVVRNSISQA